MTGIKGTTLKKELKLICDRACEGEVFIVSRPKDKNVILLSEQEYAKLEHFKTYAIELEKMIRKGNRDIDAADTYPDGFFELYGVGRDDDFEIPDELPFESDSMRVTL